MVDALTDPILSMVGDHSVNACQLLARSTCQRSVQMAQQPYTSGCVCLALPAPVHTGDSMLSLLVCWLVLVCCNPARSMPARVSGMYSPGGLALRLATWLSAVLLIQRVVKPSQLVHVKPELVSLFLLQHLFSFFPLHPRLVFCSYIWGNAGEQPK